VVAPLVFGLLAVLGVGAARKSYKKRNNSRNAEGQSKELSPQAQQNVIWRGIFVAILIFTFCRECYYGVTLGSFERTAQYRMMPKLLGDAWAKADGESIAELYKFRLQASRAEMSYPDFEAIVRDLVKPILDDDQEDKTARIHEVLKIIEPALATPAGNKG
jgi:hypothetical protein